MLQDADKTGRETLPIPDQPHRGPVPFDARRLPHGNNTCCAPEGALNIVIVLIDDMGPGVPSAFRSCVGMPITDRLAKAGLRYPRTEQFLKRR
jgi:hypothetical protein